MTHGRAWVMFACLASIPAAQAHAGKPEENTPVEASGAYWTSEGIELMLKGDFQAAAVVLDRQAATERADPEGR